MVNTCCPVVLILFRFPYLRKMEQNRSGKEVKEPFTRYGRYSYADYLEWQMDEMVELIKGRVFRSAAAAPRRIHQEISGRIFSTLFNSLGHQGCKVYQAPFDVRLPAKSNRHQDIDTVVQPDICVICDKSKLDERGCIGPPDLIIEILSPGNNRKELKYKYDVYEESGVSEYWVIHPSEQTVMTYTLFEGKYRPSKLLIAGDIIESKSVAGFRLDLEYVFRDLD